MAVNAASHTGRGKCLRALFINVTLKYKVNYRKAFFTGKCPENDKRQPGLTYSEPHTTHPVERRTPDF